MDDRIEVLLNAIREHEEEEEEEEQSYRDMIVKFGKEALWIILGSIIINIGSNILSNH